MPDYNTKYTLEARRRFLKELCSKPMPTGPNGETAFFDDKLKQWKYVPIENKDAVASSL